MQLQRIALALVMAAFVTASCGDDDDSNPSTGGSGGASGGSSGAGGRGGSGGTSGFGGSAGGSGGVSGGAGGSGGSTAGSGGASGGSGGSSGSGGASGGSGGSSPDMASDTSGDIGPAGDGSASGTMSFFVTSVPAGNGGNLGGLDGADMKCTMLATAAGVTGKTWKAYLSTATANAKDRIGTGPWFNQKGVMVAANVTELHAKNGDYMVFLDETGKPVNGQWPGSPSGNQHDVMTGTNRDGTVKTGNTCMDWTSNTATPGPWVGHTDGLGPGGSMADNYRPWNSVHAASGCSMSGVGSGGGNGRIYCFATN